jgi:hypothetical protein
LSGRHANNLIEADHGWLKARLGPMRGLKRYRSARILAAGHAFVQNLRRGHYEIATETRALTGSASPSTTPPGTDCGSWGAPNRLHQQVHHHRHQYQRRGHLLASIDWEAAVTALHAGELPTSGGERRMLLLASSIAGGTLVSLNDALPGIDRRNAILAVKAIARATGQPAT